MLQLLVGVDLISKFLFILTLHFLLLAMIQFPTGFQGANLSGFSGAAANFGSFRPQFSVPGQPNNFTSSTSQVK